jgi:DNA-directed RNA polymerase specialized sigma24 family protein
MGSLSCPASPDTEIQINTRADLRHYLEVIRRNVPAYLRRHDDFESAANECLAEALRAYDPARGPFEAFLAIRAGSRVPTVMHRQFAKVPRSSIDEDGVEARLANTGRPAWDAVAPQLADGLAEAEDRLMVTDFARGLSAREHVVTIGLASGLRPVDIAAATGVGRSAVANTTKLIRGKARQYWALEPATTSGIVV